MSAAAGGDRKVPHHSVFFPYLSGYPPFQRELINAILANATQTESEYPTLDLDDPFYRDTVCWEMRWPLGMSRADLIEKAARVFTESGAMRLAADSELKNQKP